MTFSGLLPSILGPRPDVLGHGYEAFTIRIPEAGEQSVEATLVRHRAAQSGQRALLYVHGFADYFFQTELAEFSAGRNEDFYAVDLRGYGRSLRAGQLAYDMDDVSDYVPELDAAVGQIVADGHDRITVMAHSTGGLIVAMWLADRPDLDPIDLVVLNSPFLAIRAAPLIQAFVGRGVDLLWKYRPKFVLPLPEYGIYGRSIAADDRGEWTFNVEWKPLSGVPVRLGWLAAVRRAHARLRSNLGLTCPILVLCSTNTVPAKEWSEAALKGDTVLDADRIADMSTRLGRNVTCIRVQDGMHDVLLSRPAVRQTAYAAIDRWLDAHT